MAQPDKNKAREQNTTGRHEHPLPQEIHAAERKQQKQHMNKRSTTLRKILIFQCTVLMMTWMKVKLRAWVTIRHQLSNMGF